MPGRLIAPAVLGGGKGLTSRGGNALKDSDYCFPLSLIEALERKDFNLVLSVAGRGAAHRTEKKKPTTTPCHQSGSVNSSAHSITFFPPESPPTPFCPREEGINHFMDKAMDDIII